MSSAAAATAAPLVTIHCIAIVGKQNNPLYLRSYTPHHPDLKYHYIAHTACDALDERALHSKTPTDPYLGLLYTIEDLAIYGYMTNTRIKFIVVVSVAETIVRDGDMRGVFRRIHAAYVALLANPFYDVGDEASGAAGAAARGITASGRFQKWMDSIVAGA